MATRTLATLTAEVRVVNLTLGWHVPGRNTRGDLIALLHSEVSEILEAFRDHRLADATPWLCNHEGCPRYGRVASATDCSDKPGREGHPTVYGKPEGVGSECADVLIRALSMADLLELYVPYEDIEVTSLMASLTAIDVAHAPRLGAGVGDWVTWLHKRIAETITSDSDGGTIAWVLSALALFCDRHGVDLLAEFDRKLAYNRTRPYQHGGRTLVDDPA